MRNIIERGGTIHYDDDNEYDDGDDDNDDESDDDGEDADHDDESKEIILTW